jgi:hypothetical protein
MEIDTYSKIMFKPTKFMASRRFKIISLIRSEMGLKHWIVDEFMIKCSPIFENLQQKQV